MPITCTFNCSKIFVDMLFCFKNASIMAKMHMKSNIIACMCSIMSMQLTQNLCTYNLAFWMSRAWLMLMGSCLVFAGCLHH